MLTPHPPGDSLSQLRTATVTSVDLPLSSPFQNTNTALTQAPRPTRGCTFLYKGMRLDGNMNLFNLLEAPEEEEEEEKKLKYSELQCI